MFNLGCAGYTITVQNGRAGCADYLAANTCPNGTALTFGATNDGTGAEVWTVTQAGTPPSGRYFANGNYQIVSPARASCTSYLGAVTCTGGNAVGMFAGGELLTAQGGGLHLKESLRWPTILPAWSTWWLDLATS